MKHLIYISLCFIFSLAGRSQSLHAELNKSSVEIGEPFTYTLTVSSNSPLDSLIYTPSRSTLTGKISQQNGVTVNNKTYELEVAQSFTDTLYKEQDNYVWKGSYQLLAWDSAYVIIGDESILLEDSTYRFNPVLLEVTSPKADGTKDIYDIREFSTDLEEKQAAWWIFIITHWWWLSIIFILLVVLIILQVRKKAVPGEMKKVAVRKSPKEEALKALKQLEDTKLYEVDLKEYYYQTSLILRNFFTRHYGENFKEKTTHEIKHNLLHRDLEDDTIQTIVELLSKADMVKFAKSKPSLEEILRTGKRAQQIIVEIADLNLETPQ